MSDEIQEKGEAADALARHVGRMHTRLKRATELLEAGHVDAAVVLADAAGRDCSDAMSLYAQHFTGDPATQADWWLRFQYRRLRSLEAHASEDAVIDAAVALRLREHGARAPEEQVEQPRPAEEMER